MKIGIGICDKTAGKCSSLGCFRAFNNRAGSFKQYGDRNLELSAFFTCTLCVDYKENKTEDIADRLVKENIDRIHLGACAVKCKSDRYKEIVEIFEDRGIKVIDRTH